jgi:hypothetical protein
MSEVVRESVGSVFPAQALSFPRRRESIQQVSTVQDLRMVSRLRGKDPTKPLYNQSIDNKNMILPCNSTKIFCNGMEIVL